MINEGVVLNMIKKYEDAIMDSVNEMLKDFCVENKKDFIYKKSQYMTKKSVVDSKKAYIFHGRGCKILDEEMMEIIDWEFGYDNYWYGLDPLFLLKFADMNNLNTESLNQTDIVKLFDEMTEEGKMYKNAGLYYLI